LGTPGRQKVPKAVFCFSLQDEQIVIGWRGLGRFKTEILFYSSGLLSGVSEEGNIALRIGRFGRDADCKAGNLMCIK
jgi:hypothetical protein